METGVGGTVDLAQLAGDAEAAGTQDLVATVVSIFAVAVGVMCGTLLRAGASATRRVVSGVSGSLADRRPWLNRRGARPETPGPGHGASTAATLRSDRWESL
jgi:hypothetical protein